MSLDHAQETFHRSLAASLPASGRGGSDDRRVPVVLPDGSRAELTDGSVVIAAITSCTNTSNPQVMIAAGLVAEARRRTGSRDEALGEDVARPRLPGRHRLLRPGRAHALPREARLRRSSASAARPASATRARSRPEISAAIDANDLACVVGPLGQPQLRGPHPPRGADELPRVTPARRRLRPRRHDGHRPVPRSRRLRHPTARRSTCATSGRAPAEVAAVVEDALESGMFTERLRRRLRRRRELAVARGRRR